VKGIAFNSLFQRKRAEERQPTVSTFTMLPHTRDVKSTLGRVLGGYY